MWAARDKINKMACAASEDSDSYNSNRARHLWNARFSPVWASYKPYGSSALLRNFTLSHPKWPAGLKYNIYCFWRGFRVLTASLYRALQIAMRGEGRSTVSGFCKFYGLLLRYVIYFKVHCLICLLMMNPCPDSCGKQPLPKKYLTSHIFF